MEIFKMVMVKLKVMNPEINQEIQDLKKELKEIKQLIKALTIATDEGVILNADSLIIKMLKNKIK
jgi:hypothetical protein